MGRAFQAEGRAKSVTGVFLRSNEEARVAEAERVQGRLGELGQRGSGARSRGAMWPL